MNRDAAPRTISDPVKVRARLIFHTLRSAKIDARLRPICSTLVIVEEVRTVHPHPANDRTLTLVQIHMVTVTVTEAHAITTTQSPLAEANPHENDADMVEVGLRSIHE